MRIADEGIDLELAASDQGAEVDGIGYGMLDVRDVAFGADHREIAWRDLVALHLVSGGRGSGEARLHGDLAARAALELEADLGGDRSYKPDTRGHVHVLLVDLVGDLAGLVDAGEIERDGRLRGVEGESAQALQFAISTAARSGEVRGATWQEIDVDAKTWTVPAERMKAKKPHRVPLSEPALRLLRSRPRGKAGDVIFASSRDGAQLSNMAMLATVRRMQVDAVPHGLARATFKTWATECNSFPREVVEMALAHTLENKTEEAYWHGDLFEKRVSAMRAWAEFLNQPSRAASATPIHK